MLKKVILILVFVSVVKPTELNNDRITAVPAFLLAGKESKPNAWPWLAGLFLVSSQTFLCGGSIISKNHILTAAHCIQEKKELSPHGVFAILGKHDFTKKEAGTKYFYPTNISIHPDWNAFSDRYVADIAILFSTTDIMFSNHIQPVSLWQERWNQNENGEGTVVGWGISEYSLDKAENIPREVQVKRIKSRKCYEDDYEIARIASSRTFCAGGVEKGSGPCKGDSGGGFFVQRNGIWHIQGIVSVSLTESGPCDVYRSTLYTEIARYNKWISTTTKGATSKKVNQEICSHVEDIYDNATYHKSLCIVAKSQSHYEAKYACINAGMELLVVDNKIVHDAVLKSARAANPVSYYARYWVNGQKNTNGNWFSYDQTALYYDIYERSCSAGECLTIVRQDGENDMSFNGWECNRLACAYCEFFKY